MLLPGFTKKGEKISTADSQAKKYKEVYDNELKMYIEIRDAEQLNRDKSAFLRFKYNPDWKDIVKSSPKGAKWNWDTKEWEIAPSDIERLKEQIPEIYIDIKEIDYDKEIPEIFEASCKIPPLPHQKEAIEFGINHPAFFNGDQQGLGKTYESLMTAEIRDFLSPLNHVLIICGVSSLQQNWGREINKFTAHDFKILGERVTKNGKTTQKRIDKLEDAKNISALPFYIIINVETLQNKESEVVNELSDACVSGDIGMIIFDECHKCKGTTNRTESLLRLNSKYKIALSGTPIVNSPLDTYAILRWFGLENRSFWQYKNYYQIIEKKTIWRKDKDGHKREITYPQLKGFQHMDEIQNKMKHFMIRRLKDDVLTLPEKIHVDEYLEMETEQRDLYEKIYEETSQKFEREDLEEQTNPLTAFLRLREATICPSMIPDCTIKSSVKLDRMKEIVEETVQNGEKILIFSFYAQPIKEILKRLKEFHPACIVAGTKDVEKEKEKFRTSTDVMVGTIKVLGTGHTLTEASTVLFLDFPWTNADLEQAEDRTHRIGQNKTVTYINLICRDTVDERIAEIVKTKKDLSDMIVDDKKRLTPKFLLKRNKK